MVNPGNLGDRVRICPSCDEPNPVNAIACGNCGYAELANAPVTSLFDEEAPPASSNPVTADRHPPVGRARETAVEKEESLTFICLETKRAFRARSGDILGREEAGREEVFHEEIDTVSRRHARIAHNGVNWEIEDLGSTNGTYVDNRKIEPGRRYVIKNGDVLNFSMRCTLKVVES